MSCETDLLGEQVCYTICSENSVGFGGFSLLNEYVCDVVSARFCPIFYNHGVNSLLVTNQIDERLL